MLGPKGVPVADLDDIIIIVDVILGTFRVEMVMFVDVIEV
jgi:hypothetical protein